MSFVELATLTLHRRHAMEDRISSFASKCDLAITNIRKLKAQTRTFVDKLNCDPSELKERFLSCMTKLDEYIYLMTEFILSVENLENNGSMELAPVQDNSYKNYPVMTPINLMDVLSERAPTSSTACFNLCPAEKPHIRKRTKAEQLLISFSSDSCSAESFNEERGSPEKEVQGVEDIKDLAINDPSALVTLPAQATLEADRAYEASITCVDRTNFWVAVQQTPDVYSLILEMTEYYEAEDRVELPPDEMPNCTCCAFYDAQDTRCYFRAFFTRTEDDSGGAELFLVDTGEVRRANAGRLLPLAPRFCSLPPYARSCHLADVELSPSKGDEIEHYLKQFLGKTYTMKVDDNTSESLGVYIFLEGECTLNERLLLEGLATFLDKPSRLKDEESEPVQGPSEPVAKPNQGPSEQRPRPNRGPELVIGPPELVRQESINGTLDYCGPEHENPVEAVTGYNSRDEMDICKHYKGGPDKTCFKGPRCQKRHVLKHPDGWTRDRVPVAGKVRGPPLPAPGTTHTSVVTYVCHFDRLYVHFDQDKVKEELPSFGVVLPPMTLASLVRDMNSPATYAAMKPLQLAPAPGEMVAAKYLDGLWYRARVCCSTRADQNVEVMYIDYGNVVCVKENEIMVLEPRFTALPAQAVLCRLAGVEKLDDCSRRWAAAKARLTQLAQDHTMRAHIIERGYDVVTVEMFDEQGFNLAEQLAAGGDVAYKQDYQAEDDSRRRFQLVLP